MSFHYLQDKTQAAYVAENPVPFMSQLSYFFQPLLLLAHVNANSCLFCLLRTPCSYHVFLCLLHCIDSKWWIPFISQGSTQQTLADHSGYLLFPLQGPLPSYTFIWQYHSCFVPGLLRALSVLLFSYCQNPNYPLSVWANGTSQRLFDLRLHSQKC